MLVTSKEKNDLIRRLIKYFKNNDIKYEKKISKTNKVKYLYYLTVYSKYSEYEIILLYSFFLKYEFKNKKFFELKITTEFGEDLKSDYILFEGMLNILKE